jgi:hypothetical protein
MHKPTLVILAAGMASRYGSQKQTEGFGPTGETIMDYSIYDAIKAGFGKIVFIIREDFAKHFEPVFTKKLAMQNVEIAFVYQSLDKFTEGYTIPTDRTKPWGTAHAMLCTMGVVMEPFAIINADDFYGKDAFTMAANFLTTQCNPSQQAIIGYALKNTLSQNGTVSRGVCALDNDGNLSQVVERVKVYANGEQMVYEEDGKEFAIDAATKASMNFWCFHPTVIDLCKEQFLHFLQAEGQALKSEFFLPLIGDYLIQHKIATIQVIPTNAQWFGVTYKEDAPIVKERVTTLTGNGTYPANLWNV